MRIILMLTLVALAGCVQSTTDIFVGRDYGGSSPKVLYGTWRNGDTTVHVERNKSRVCVATFSGNNNGDPFEYSFSIKIGHIEDHTFVQAQKYPINRRDLYELSSIPLYTIYKTVITDDKNTITLTPLVLPRGSDLTTLSPHSRVFTGKNIELINYIKSNLGKMRVSSTIMPSQTYHRIK